MKKNKVTDEDRKLMPSLTDEEIEGVINYQPDMCIYCGYPFSEEEYNKNNCCPQCLEN